MHAEELADLLDAPEELTAWGEAEEEVDVGACVEGGVAGEDEGVRQLEHERLLADDIRHLRVCVQRWRGQGCARVNMANEGG